MQLSERWLREFVDPGVERTVLVHQLTMAGLEVDSVERAAPEFSGVVVAEVCGVEPHPKADRLRICHVNRGSDATIQVVCGAPNVAPGMRVPLACEGAELPSGLSIRRSELRGVSSEGMLCSAKELGLEDGSEGLMKLPDDAPIGADLRKYLDLDDWVIEVDLTPNRADCLSVEGIAREVAVLFETTRAHRAPRGLEMATEQTFPVHVAAPAACPRYLGRIVRNISRGVTTPLWLRERLRRCGVRSIDPIVDATNYVLLEYGQPLHAFDLDTLRGGIEVRYARPGETLALLNDASVTLDGETLVVADQERALALAGIMGGRDSAVTASTRDIFIECAYFSPAVIMGRARRYGLATESSHRFERGVDPELQERALTRCTELILDMVGGDPGPVNEFADMASIPPREEIFLRAERIGRVLGVDVSPDRVADLLRRLSMEVREVGHGWQVRAPSFRFDIASEIDLIEEIGRVSGYDQIPLHRPLMPATMQAASEHVLDVDRFRDALVDRGYQEVVTYSFVEPGLSKLIDPEADALVLKNPISAEMAVMRTSLWPGLIETARRNQARQQERIRVFEVGSVFRTMRSGLDQPACIAGLVTGPLIEEQWGLRATQADFFDVKADLEAMYALCGQTQGLSFVAAPHPSLHPGQSAKVRVGPGMHGWIGMLHPSLERSLGFQQSVFVFEIELAQALARSVPRFRMLSRFPQVRRDLAVVIDDGVSTDRVIACARTAGGDLIREAILFDVYTGEGVAAGQKSVAFGLILQSDDETLTDDRIDELMCRVIEGLKNELAAELRA